MKGFAFYRKSKKYLLIYFTQRFYWYREIYKNSKVPFNLFNSEDLLVYEICKAKKIPFNLFNQWYNWYAGILSV